jgi:hypothetical protein
MSVLTIIYGHPERVNASAPAFPDLTWRRLWLALLCRARYFQATEPRKEGRAMTTFFRHYRQRGPVNALQMRLQG